MKKRIAIISTHPIQYNAPLFRELSKSEYIDIKVFYTLDNFKERINDPGFGKNISWDIPLLDGYEYEFVPNSKSFFRSKSFLGTRNPQLISLIEAWGADIVWVFGWNFFSHLSAMKYFKEKKEVWFRGDSTILNDKSGFKSWMRGAILRFVYSFVDKALYVGQNNKEYFLKFGLKESQLIWAPHAIDIKRFADEKFDKPAQEWREKLGYKNDDVVLIYCGKFIPCKNLLSFVSQFLKFSNQKSSKKLHLLLVGNGPLEKELKHLAGSNELIKFLPFQNQSLMPVIYRVGDVFILPSVNETWGLGINEAMATGRAVIASNMVGCARDLIDSEVSGWLFSTKIPNQNFMLFESITKTKSENIGSRNKEFIKSWSYTQIAKQVESLILNK